MAHHRLVPALIGLFAAGLGLECALAQGQIPPPIPPIRPTNQFSDYSRVNQTMLQSMTFDPRERTEANARYGAEATVIANRLGVPCTSERAARISQGRRTFYEMVCAEGRGWVVSATARNTDAKAYDCLALAAWNDAAMAEGRRFPLTCELPENRDRRAAVQPLAQKAGLGCRVNDVAWIGQGGEPAISRYEVGCEGSDGYIVDVPAPGSRAQSIALSCLEASEFSLQCRLTTKAEQLAAWGSRASRVAAGCKPEDVRFFGGDEKRAFYELRCAGGRGVVVETSSGAEPVRAIDCARLTANPGGGCKLTQLGSPATRRP